MATLATLRKQAKEAGVPASRIRSAEDASELRQIIKSHTKATNGTKKKGAAKKAVGKAVVSKPKRAKKAEVEAPKRRGRPPGSKNKTAISAGSKSKPATKSGNSGKAKRPTAAKATRVAMEESGRNLLDTIDYRETEGWNAREGSAPDRIVKALRKFKGKREKVFDYLVGDIWDFVAKKRRDGTKNTRTEAEKMLRYRIARTDWDFAMRTGQHTKAENRAEYGTAGTGAGTFKPAGSKVKAKGNSTKTKTTKTKARATAKATPAKRGRPKKTEAVAGKRGRPVGSKNKAKVKTRGKK